MTVELRRFVVLFAFTLLFTISSLSSAQSGALTNVHVVEMVEAGLPPEIIVTAIRQARKRDFVLSPDALIELKKKGVPDMVIATMFDPANSNDLVNPQEEGIYLEVEENGSRQLIRLTESKTTGMKASGGFRSAFTLGMSRMTTKYRVRDTQAEHRLVNPQPTFYVSRIDPRDLVLLKLEKKGDEREFESGKIGGITGELKGPKGDATFTSEKLPQGGYRLTFPEPLEPGEYGFGIIGSAGFGMVLQVYDFGVDPPTVSPVSR